MADISGTILLVDDDRTVREVLVEKLSQEGFEVVEAENGEQGVALALQRRPDLIISDIIMPRMDGWDLCTTLRLMPSTKTIPFVFLTSMDKTPDRILGIKLGADDYLTKPFTPQAVVFKVKAILKRVTGRQRLLELKEAQTRDTDARILLADVIEYLRHTQRTGLLAVYGKGEKGIIYIRRGHPVHASLGRHQGEAAVYEIIKLGAAQVKYVEQEYPDLEENVVVSWEVLMDRIFQLAGSNPA